MSRLAWEGMTAKDLYDHVLKNVERFCPNWVAPDPEESRDSTGAAAHGGRGRGGGRWTGTWVIADRGAGQGSSRQRRGKPRSAGGSHRVERPMPYDGKFEQALAQ